MATVKQAETKAECTFPIGVRDFSSIDAVRNELKACRAAYTLVTIYSNPECRMLMSRSFTHVEYCFADGILQPQQRFWARASIQFQRGKVPAMWEVLYWHPNTTVIDLRQFFGLRYVRRNLKQPSRATGGAAATHTEAKTRQQQKTILLYPKPYKTMVAESSTLSNLIATADTGRTPVASPTPPDTHV